MEKLKKENLIYDTTGPEDVVKKHKLEVVIDRGGASVIKILETLDLAINHDKPVTELNLSNLHLAIKGMKITIGGKELTLKDVESISSFSVFLNDLYELWGVAETNLPTPDPSFVSPEEINYKERSEHPDVDRFGRYTLNPETVGVDFEKVKVFIPDLSSMTGKKCYEVFKHVVDTYGEKYYVPGIEYWKWMLENPDKAEEAAKKQNYDIKDGNRYHFPGSSLCGRTGNWLVPGARWISGEFYRNAYFLGQGWDSNDRVLLLEK